MPSRRRLLAAPARRLLSGIAGLLGIVLVVVDAGYAPASQARVDDVEAPIPSVETVEVARGEGSAEERGQADDEQPPPTTPEPREAHGHGAPAVQPFAQAQVPPTHVVQPGETAGEIAGRYGVGTGALVRANRHARPESLQPGELLVVPDPDAQQPLTPQEAADADLEVELVLEETARRYGWNPATVKAIAWYESRWNQRLVSDQEAIGVMQVQPATGELMERLLERPLDLHDLHDNVEAGVAYLDRLHQHFRGDLRAIIAAYHQGPQALRTRGIYRVSDVYTDEVLRLRIVFGG